MSNQPQDNIKDDSGKPRLALLPGYCPLTLEALGRLATFGAAKHGEGSWMEGEQYRWLDAAYRHLSEYHKGEKIDPETGENHLVAVCINFMYACELELSATPLPPKAELADTAVRLELQPHKMYRVYAELSTGTQWVSKKPNEGEVISTTPQREAAYQFSFAEATVFLNNTNSWFWEVV